MGHSPPGLEGSYLKPTEEELLSEFVKVIPYLTLGQEDELKREVERLKVQSGDVDLIKKSYLDVRMELEREREERKKLLELLYKQGIITKDN